MQELYYNTSTADSSYFRIRNIYPRTLHSPLYTHLYTHFFIIWFVDMPSIQICKTLTIKVPSNTQFSWHGAIYIYIYSIGKRGMHIQAQPLDNLPHKYYIHIKTWKYLYHSRLGKLQTMHIYIFFLLSTLRSLLRVSNFFK